MHDADKYEVQYRNPTPVLFVLLCYPTIDFHSFVFYAVQPDTLFIPTQNFSDKTGFTVV